MSNRFHPSLIDAYLEFTSGHESTEKIRRWCIISVIAAAMERKVWIPRGHYELYPNLYTFIIGQSGLVKKSTTTAIAVNLLREVGKVNIMSERLTSASLVHQLAAAGKKFRIDENTLANQSAVFAYASELAVFLTEVFGSITELLTTFYDCQPRDSNKPWISNTIVAGERKIFGPCLNILGASTKTWLRRCIPTSEMEGGFTSRIIFVVEENPPDKIVAWPEVNPELEEMRKTIVEDLKEVHKMIGPMRVEEPARKMFQAWYEDHVMTTMRKNIDPTMAGYHARKGDTILKLAITKSAARSSDKLILKEDILWAQNELTSLEPGWRFAFKNVQLNDRLHMEIMDFITCRGTVTRNDVFIAFDKTVSFQKLSKALDELCYLNKLKKRTLDLDGQKRVDTYTVIGT